MSSIKFFSSLPRCDPQQRPCTIIGKSARLRSLPYDAVKPFLTPRVDEETWKAGVLALSDKTASSCALWLQRASVGGLPNEASRHNTPSRAHALTQLVQSERKEGKETAIIIVCDRAEVLALGCAAARAFPLYSRKTDGAGSSKTEPRVVSIGFVLTKVGGAAGGDPAPLTEEDIACLTAVSEGVRMAAEIVDAPTNEMHTDTFLDKIRWVGSEVGVTSLVIQGEELDKKGFGGIYGVGKAAVHQPALAVLSHTPSGADETITWVGKGIVYDTGGLSIKGKLAMPGMKRDCGGAAAILGAFYAAVKLGFKQNLHAVFCLAENSVGPIATRPDDIHTLYSGKTVEINNTDAEGRLVLGDGVAYARRDLKADWVVDLATLTGAQGISTGRYHAGVLTNCEDCQTAVFNAGRTCGDLNFALLYCPELHFGEFKSAVADMKNSVADRSNAQSSCAGLFIGAHLGFDFEGVWIHVDMAAPVYKGERATGYGVALLLTTFGGRSDNALLQAAAPHFACHEKWLAAKAKAASAK